VTEWARGRVAGWATEWGGGADAMGSRSRRRRRLWRRFLRTALFVLLLLGALPGLVAAGVSGEAQLLWLIPAGMAAAVLGAPFALIGLLVMALPLVTTGLIVGVPLVLVYKMMGAQRRGDPAFTPEVRLRRRYVAGELSYAEFRDTMLERLKTRFADGELRLAEYEAEVERLLRPGRQLDAGRDPSLSDAWRP
jgi:hypothetical protein